MTATSKRWSRSVYGESRIASAPTVVTRGMPTGSLAATYELEALPGVDPWAYEKCGPRVDLDLHVDDFAQAAVGSDAVDHAGAIGAAKGRS